MRDNRLTEKYLVANGRPILSFISSYEVDVFTLPFMLIDRLSGRKLTSESQTPREKTRK